MGVRDVSVAFSWIINDYLHENYTGRHNSGELS